MLVCNDAWQEQKQRSTIIIIGQCSRQKSDGIHGENLQKVRRCSIIGLSNSWDQKLDIWLNWGIDARDEDFCAAGRSNALNQVQISDMEMELLLGDYWIKACLFSSLDALVHKQRLFKGIHDYMCWKFTSEWFFPLNQTGFNSTHSPLVWNWNTLTLCIFVCACYYFAATYSF